MRQGRCILIIGFGVQGLGVLPLHLLDLSGHLNSYIRIVARVGPGLHIVNLNKNTRYFAGNFLFLGGGFGGFRPGSV
jgi:hypothetical protein